MTPHRALALVGPGRAGTTVAAAATCAGFRVSAVAGSRPGAPSTLRACELLDAPATEVDVAADGADLVVLAVPDDALPAVAARVGRSLPAGALVVHLAGARGIDVFTDLLDRSPAARVGALHPLRSLRRSTSPAHAGAQLAGAPCAVAGDPEVEALARALRMTPFSVADGRRAAYHATAAVASNHLVALVGQVERLAAHAGVPVEVFGDLMRTTLERVPPGGAASALTGPVARGDVSTVEAHLASIPAAEGPGYRALAREALRLVEMESPALAALLGVGGAAAGEARSAPAGREEVAR